MSLRASKAAPSCAANESISFMIIYILILVI
jgi:hypothetical protein